MWVGGGWGGAQEVDSCLLACLLMVVVAAGLAAQDLGPRPSGRAHTPNRRPPGQLSSVGDPIVFRMSCSWSISLLPGKSGSLLRWGG